MLVKSRGEQERVTIEGVCCHFTVTSSREDKGRQTHRWVSIQQPHGRHHRQSPNYPDLPRNFLLSAKPCLSTRSRNIKELGLRKHV